MVRLARGDATGGSYGHLTTAACQHTLCLEQHRRIYHDGAAVVLELHGALVSCFHSGFVRGHDRLGLAEFWSAKGPTLFRWRKCSVDRVQLRRMDDLLPIKAEIRAISTLFA